MKRLLFAVFFSLGICGNFLWAGDELAHQLEDEDLSSLDADNESASEKIKRWLELTKETYFHFEFQEFAMLSTTKEFVSFLDQLSLDILAINSSTDPLKAAKMIWLYGRVITYARAHDDFAMSQAITREVMAKLLALVYENPKILFATPKGASDVKNKAKLLVNLQAAQSLAELAVHDPQFFSAAERAASLRLAIQTYAQAEESAYPVFKDRITRALSVAQLMSMSAAEFRQFYGELIGGSDRFKVAEKAMVWVEGLGLLSRIQTCLEEKITTTLDDKLALDFRTVRSPLPLELLPDDNRNLDAPVQSSQKNILTALGRADVRGGKDFLLATSDVEQPMIEARAMRTFIDDLSRAFLVYKHQFGLPGQVLKFKYLDKIELPIQNTRIHR